jgi:hypothetical protein
VALDCEKENPFLLSISAVVLMAGPARMVDKMDTPLFTVTACSPPNVSPVESDL